MIDAFIGPTLRSGIGQHCRKYCELFPNAKYYSYSEQSMALPKCDRALLFLIPAGPYENIIRYCKSQVKHLELYTVCETETVHPEYGKMFEHFDRCAVPSEFCRDVLAKQFPGKEFYVLPVHIPQPPYVFYHIGNVKDEHRKNFLEILRAFIELNIEFPDTRFLVKATCNDDVHINHKHVEVINGVLSDGKLDLIHDSGHCYVNFSNSEGAGMGAIEAAIRDKPVIITAFGAPVEYIKTPYTIECEKQEIQHDDFLFQKGMVWGKPNPQQLRAFMRDAYLKRLTYMDHSHTKQMVSKENISHQFVTRVFGRQGDETDENST
ncbi:hypothetical protein DSLPV1_200 [Dishui lake phycodnavirus 1]|uniref:hypothetical protein n=1 Tax=Dishui lake phycodnavirus 1 TaxID=2079134 RepID=UPI000CD6A990|nr:hypothetical protein C5Y57_gp198 [Dishui lake phycodnavirus 1]AUT19171.1 hypothetical protein DSLPV1_200 [Dishui lake phycodnavirus 1]